MLPTDPTGSEPAFSKTLAEELWVILLEKAWVKLFGSYENTEGGCPSEVLHNLTGAPVKKIVLNNNKFNKYDFWKELKKSSKKVYAMVSGSKQFP